MIFIFCILSINSSVKVTSESSNTNDQEKILAACNPISHEMVSVNSSKDEKNWSILEKEVIGKKFEKLNCNSAIDSSEQTFAKNKEEETYSNTDTNVDDEQGETLPMPHYALSPQNLKTLAKFETDVYEFFARIYSRYKADGKELGCLYYIAL